jgi:hypothetical protein
MRFYYGLGDRQAEPGTPGMALGFSSTEKTLKSLSHFIFSQTNARVFYHDNYLFVIQGKAYHYGAVLPGVAQGIVHQYRENLAQAP